MACQTSRLSSIQSPLIPILGNPGFPPGIAPGLFRNLLERGCFQTSHFLISDNWPTVSTLMQLGGRNGLKFWQALQLSHYFRSLGPSANFQRQRTPFELYCEDGDPLSNTLSRCIPC